MIVILFKVLQSIQAYIARLERGDISGLKGINGEEENTYGMFIDLTKSHHPPMVFNLWYISTTTTISMTKKPGDRCGDSASEKAYLSERNLQRKISIKSI